MQRIQWRFYRTLYKKLNILEKNYRYKTEPHSRIIFYFFTTEFLVIPFFFTTALNIVYRYLRNMSRVEREAFN